MRRRLSTLSRPAIARDAQGQAFPARRHRPGLRRPGRPTPPSSPSTAAMSGMFHAKSFEEYAATRVIPARISRARKLMQVHAPLLGRIEQQFGVPAPVIVAV